MKKRLSVIICTYNRSNTLKELLDCLLIQDLKEPFEIIVVDNNSKDDTKSVVSSFESKFQGRLKCFFEPKQGKPFALNLGIKEAQGEILVFTDDDCVVEKDYLLNVYEAYQKYGPEIGVLGGRIIPRWVNGDKPEWIIDLKPGWWFKAFFTGPLGMLDYGDKPYLIGIDDVNKGNLFYGANMCIRKEALERHGYFSIEKILTQDTEICVRLFRAGLKGMYMPQIIVYHRVDAKKITPQFYYRWYYLRGTLLEIKENYQKKFYHPFGVRWGFIVQTIKLWFNHMSSPSLGYKIYHRSHALFNLGQMVQIAKNKNKKGAS